MRYYKGFTKAKAVFIKDKSMQGNTFAAFYDAVIKDDCDKNRYVLSYTGRTYIRVSINGVITAVGPARTGEFHSRVDEIDITEDLHEGRNTILFEVAGYAKALVYQNDNTTEYSFLMFEIKKGDNVISYSCESTKSSIIYQRHTRAPRHSHSSAIMEVYDIDEAYIALNNGDISLMNWESSEEITAPKLLPRSMRYPYLGYTSQKQCIGAGSFVIDESVECTPFFFENDNEEATRDCESPSFDMIKTKEIPLKGGKLSYIGGTVTYIPSDKRAYTYVCYDLKTPGVGFICFDISAKEACTVDIAYSEYITENGSVSPRCDYNTSLRVNMPEGRVCFTSFTPYSFRYIKFYIRSKGAFTVYDVRRLDFNYPDVEGGSFLCNDDDVNRIYEAARRTLQMNTLDIFMDCPDRERGGWLCDSLWTARSAQMMYGDTSVERAMLENFLCLPLSFQERGLFPACYPAADSCTKNTIMTWSFYLAIELYEYYIRTNDRDLIDEYKSRIEALIQGTESMCKKGILESSVFCFIDWSLSNSYNVPISTAANALYARVLYCMGELYEKSDYIARADEIKSIIESTALNGDGIIADALHFDENDALKRKDVYSEAAHYTTLWSGLFAGNKKLLYEVVHSFGLYPTSISEHYNIGKANVFIGQCLRFDMLAKLGEYDILFSEIKQLCGRMLKEGPGTLWETLSGSASRCHGFMSHVGVHLQRDVLGIGIPDEINKQIRVQPHLCGLTRAQGSVSTLGGAVFLRWYNVHGEFKLDCTVPDGYTAILDMPPEIAAYHICLNGEALEYSREIVLRESFTVSASC